MAYKILLTLILGITVRYWLFQSSLAAWLRDRPEVVTPLTSWKRLTEGLALRRANISPYTGDIYHEPPLTLLLIGKLTQLFGEQNLFILLDLLLACILERVAKYLGKYLLTRQKSEVKTYHVSSIKLILRAESLELTRFYVVAAYMFNPLAVAACVARSTAVFNNIAISLMLLFTLRGNRLLASSFLALATYQSLYPVTFIIPVALFLLTDDIHRMDSEEDTVSSKTQHQQSKAHRRRWVAVVSVVQTLVCTVSAFAILLYTSFSLEDSTWDFLRSTYGFILLVPDLTPNIGVFWYFFTEMFDHFRDFFLVVFQMHVFIYAVPLSVRLHRHPIFLFFCLLSLQALFKSYPSYSDVALYTALLPVWRHTMKYTRNTFIVVIMFIVGVVLAPVLWHLWMETGTANANFYFAITLVITSAQVFLLTDLLFAFLRREYDLLHGTEKPVVNGKPATVILE